jgi:hypothetical protein
MRIYQHSHLTMLGDSPQVGNTLAEEIINMYTGVYIG